MIDVSFSMIQQVVIEEHPATQPPPWISNAVIPPKADRVIRMTLDAHNVNKAIQSNQPTDPSTRRYQSQTQQGKGVFKDGLQIGILATRAAPGLEICNSLSHK